MTSFGGSALERCVGDPVRFLEDNWARAPLHHRSGRSFEDILSLADVDHILSSTFLRLPSLRLVKDGETLPSSAYTKTGRTGSRTVTGIADSGRIHRLFDEGATIVLQGAHRFWGPLAQLCRDLEVTLGHPTQVNVYVTPPGSRGLAVHHDGHDVFVLQAFGRKHWEVWETPSRDGPSAAGPSTRGEPDPGAPMLSVELEPGDSLYLPLGTPHGARTQEVLSGHLTVGILTFTWKHLLRDVLAWAGREPTFGDRLPVAFYRDPAAFRSEVEARVRDLQALLGKADAAELADGIIRRFLTTRQTVAEGTLAGLARLDQLSDATRVRRRPGSFCELSAKPDVLRVRLGDRELRMPPGVEPAMRMIAEREDFRVADLALLLDPESRLVLVRRLIREGLLLQGPSED